MTDKYYSINGELKGSCLEFTGTFHIGQMLEAKDLIMQRFLADERFKTDKVYEPKVTNLTVIKIKGETCIKGRVQLGGSDYVSYVIWGVNLGIKIEL